MKEVLSVTVDRGGYLDPGYARSLREFGDPIQLPRSGGWLLRRKIPGVDAWDAMGCYPIFACRDWTMLGADLAELAGELVSVVLVADPFGGYSESDLSNSFDRVVEFKLHHVIDFDRDGAGSGTKHHRYYTRRAAREVQVDLCPDPPAFLDEWTALYRTLVERRDLRGIKAFSRAAFAEQLALPGTVVFRARRGADLVGAHWFLVRDEVAYSHLAAVSRDGYAYGAAYVLYREAIDHLAGRIRWIDLGAGAGIASDTMDGLARFKRGWANAVRPVHLCGRILDPLRYRELASERPPSSYFPQYRHGEFA